MSESRWVMKKFIIFLAMITVLPAGVYSQSEIPRESVFSDYLNAAAGENFLRIPGFDFHTSMGFSFFSSDQFGSVGMGYYMGHFDLQLSRSLNLHWDVGLRSMLSGSRGDQNPQLFIPNIDLTYKPSDKFFMRLQFHQSRYPSQYLYRR